MKKLIVIFSSFFLIVSNLSISTSVFAEESEVDLSSIDKIAQTRVDNGTTPGVTVLVKKGDQLLYNKSFGWSYLYDMDTKLDNPIEATNDTVYDLASVTKVMATTQAVMKLVDEEKMDIDVPITNYLDNFGTKGKENITSRQLLTHTSGLPQWEPSYLYVDTRESEKNYVNNLELMFEPGTYHYSDFSFMILAFIVEEITGQPLEVYLEENIYGPLSMDDTMFVPLENGVDSSRIAATSWGNPYEWRMSNQRDWNVGYDTSEHQEAFDNFEGWREYTLIGEVNDGNAGMGNEGVAGHAGLFSTASDLSVLGELMLNGGEKNGLRLYSEQTLKMFTTLQPGIPNRGLGWRVGGSKPGSGYVGDKANENTFAHDGFTGTHVVFHPDYDLQVIVLSNKQNYGPYNDRGSYYSTYAMSREINNLVFDVLLEDIAQVDKSNLENLIFEASKKVEKDYTSSTWMNLINTLEKSEKILLSENVIQSEVDSVYNELSVALEKLVLNRVGWIKEGDSWYYYSEDNKMQTGWVKIKSNWYYLSNNGVMQINWTKVGNIWYYMSTSGAMQTGWNKVGNIWYYMSTSGAMQTGWNKVGNTWYYMSTSGAMQTGWNKVGNTWYYMSDSGAMQTGWNKVGSTWYYMSSSGAMQTGWNRVGPTWYYMNKSGAMQTGWIKSGPNWYYLNNNGSMQTTRTSINGRTYRFHSSGRIL